MQFFTLCEHPKPPDICVCHHALACALEQSNPTPSLRGVSVRNGCLRASGRARKRNPELLETTPMGHFSLLAFAAAFMVALIIAFSIVRRVMHLSTAPRWLTATPVAYAIALIMTVLFALSLFNVTNAVQVQVPNVAVAGIIAAGLHILTWVIIRKIIRLKGSGLDTPPHVGLPGGGALPSAT